MGKKLTTEQKWRLLWITWGASFMAAETIAIRSKHPHAPLSHHLRCALRAEKSTIGQLVLLSAASWLHRHLFPVDRKGITE